MRRIGSLLLMLVIAAVLGAELRAETERRLRPVRRETVTFTGSVVVHMFMPVSEENRAAMQEARSEFEALGVTITADGVEFPTLPGIGYWVEVGPHRVMSHSDGKFEIPADVSAITEGRIVGPNNFYKAAFPVQQHLVRKGETAAPIIVTYRLNDGPNEMNRLHVPPHGATGREDFEMNIETLIATAGTLGAKPPDRAGCPSHATCGAARCNPGICCLDYDGVCKDAPPARWTECALRYVQFFGSTCFWWVMHQNCCLNEGALTDAIGPGCVDNHRGRECQSLDPMPLGLQLTAADIRPTRRIDPRGEDLSDDTESETVQVGCGETIQIQLHNNTCSNESEVSFNAYRALSFCVAWGDLERVGTIEHFEQIKADDDNSEESSSYRHINDVSIFYRAPDTISCAKASDVVKVDAGGKERTLNIEVTCGQQPKTRLETPYFSPPGGTYPEPHVDVAISLPGGGEATIHYTTDGTNPSRSSASVRPGQTVRVAQSLTLKARAYKSGSEPSFIASNDYQIWKKSPPPSINPEGAVSPAPIDVRLTCPASAVCYYTTDGSVPLETSPGTWEGSTSLTVERSLTLKARAFRPFAFPSDVKTADFRIGDLQKAAAPVLSPPAGIYSSALQVAAVSSTPGAVIHYTIDGGLPAESDPVPPIAVNRTMTIRARTFAPNHAPSDETTARYELVVATPTFNPPGGTYTAPQSVMIESATGGGSIHYSVDGSDPTPSHPTAVPVSVDRSMTIRARAFLDGWSASVISEATYVIAAVVCEPGGTYNTTFTVKSDPGGHAPFIGLNQAVLFFEVSSSSVFVSGNHTHTISASGVLNIGSCVFTARGTGTVAGFDNVECVYGNVAVEGNAAMGEYTCGTRGELPGGQPITYTMTGAR